MQADRRIAGAICHPYGAEEGKAMLKLEKRPPVHSAYNGQTVGNSQGMFPRRSLLNLTFFCPQVNVSYRSCFLWDHVGSHSKAWRDHRHDLNLLTAPHASNSILRWFGSARRNLSSFCQGDARSFDASPLSAQGCQIPSPLSVHTQLPTTASPKKSARAA